MKQDKNKKEEKEGLRQLSENELSQVTGGIAGAERKPAADDFEPPLPRKPGDTIPHD